MFGFVALLVVGGMAAVAFLVTQIVGGDRETAVIVWISGCSLAVAFPILAMGIARRAFRGIATPLANVMAAADAVAEGDLSVRVPETSGRNEFVQLTRSFNRMTAELERADLQRRNLTADVAHELRTPLHIIQGNLEGIIDGVYQPTDEHITATLDETRLLARLVDDLHTLSLAEAGQLPLKREKVIIDELLADIYTSFSGQAEAKGIDLTVISEPGLTTQGDMDRLDQALSNLVVNALRHTSAAGEIHLQARRVGTEIRIQVRDTGEGISAADLPYIFDRFWRGDRSRSHASGAGGGLGLAIVKQLVRAHNGRVDVESTPGQGTTFTITFPGFGFETIPV
jgi:signal transduction histidine kinase